MWTLGVLQSVYLILDLKCFRDVAGFACILDGDGDVTDFLRLPHILKRKNHNAPDTARDKMSELEKLKDFIHERKPHVIAVAGESRWLLVSCLTACRLCLCNTSWKKFWHEIVIKSETGAAGMMSPNITTSIYCIA